MNGFSSNDTFPTAVQRAQLSEGTVIHTEYRIRKAFRSCKTELTYLAQSLHTGETVCLHELLPMRWCMRGEDGSWIPYHTEAQIQFEAVRSSCAARLERLWQLYEETALETILDMFEDRGTLWTVTEYTEAHCLTEELSQRLFTPQEAITMLTPVLDTLAGLHGEELFHGAISEHSILLQGGNAVLTGWCVQQLEGSTPASAQDDVSSICSLLYLMMTGERVYRSATASALPSGIRRALRDGIQRKDMTLEQLWHKLHADSPSRRSARVQHHAGNPLLRRIFSPAFTAVFCVLCAVVVVLTAVAVMSGGGLEDSDYVLSAEEIRVPEFLYLSQEEAVQTAEEMGLHVIIASREDNPVVEKDYVITQQPNAGAMLHAGETVRLTISDGWSNYVPNVCNLLREEAEAKLTELGFIVKWKEIVSAGDAPNTVISQSVKPETDLARDSVITLTVSLGRDDLDTSKLETVGNYVGMDFEEAKKLLSDLHLYAFQLEAVYDPEIPEGVVISQEIPEGRQVPQGTVINMVVSLGVETVRMPHVMLMNANSAKAMLEGLRLKAVLIYAADAGHAMDTVIAQNVKTGQLIPVDSEVWLTVSLGSENRVVSTGGWSGAPLPTVESTEETTETTTESETVPTETEQTSTEMQETTSLWTEHTSTTEPVTTTTEYVQPTETETTAATPAQETTTVQTTPPETTAVPTTVPPETQAPTSDVTQEAEAEEVSE